MSWEDHVQEFWEGVHKRGASVHIGNTQAEDYTTYFSQAGPFVSDLERSKAVLDIGPGFCRFLDALKGKARLAVDVAETSRDRARGVGAEAFAPGDVGAGVADLVTCLSVIQHCDEPSTKVILADAARALRSGGAFYLNGVFGGHHTPSPEGLLHGGRFSYSPDRMRELLQESGLAVDGEHVYKIGALTVWIFRAIKP
jgi:SAM-dependent methyltransferase